ncbi:lipase family protein [Gordonia sp. UBA6683]|uniref:lipase family protein n=1 Tax=Gordonia sp. UBA6683 TaxID=1946577 RepID=UPI0025C57ACA|nr:lipase family protein [Gordonia sp. UBA6683]
MSPAALISTFITRRRATSALAVGLVCVLAIAVSGCARSTDDTPLTLSPAAAAYPASPLPSASLTTPRDTGKPGAVLAVEDPPRGPIKAINNRDAVVKRIIYRSTSGIDNSATEVSGILVVPKGTPPAGGWPLVAFGHGNSGIESTCGPSEYANLLGNDTIIEAFRLNGYAVVMSDYQGLGYGKEIHPFLDAKTYGNNQIDAVRAAQAIAPDVSNHWVSFGVSLGGMAAWAAGDRQPGYGSDTNLDATVALVPVGDMRGLADRAAQGTLTRDQYPLLVYALDSLAKTFPDRFNLDDYRSERVKSEWDTLVQCVPDSTGDLTATQRALSELTPQDLMPKSAAATTALRDQLADYALPVGRTNSPVLVMYGTDDPLIPPQWTERVIGKSCEAGENLTIVKRVGDTHAGLDSAQAIPWMKGVLNGDKPESNCDNRP